MAGVADLVGAAWADAVGDHAHAEGVCHRDLKPGNILVDAEGNPHILDFGLARLDPLTAMPRRPCATSDGHILGSLAYMAARSRRPAIATEADARSDVYALGVILYELLTGRLPFEGPAYALPAQVIEDQPPRPRLLNHGYSARPGGGLSLPLAKKPEERYATAAGLANDLRAFLRGEASRGRNGWPGWCGSSARRWRTHRDMRQKGWTLLLLLLGLTIFVGCTTANVWQLWPRAAVPLVGGACDEDWCRSP